MDPIVKLGIHTLKAEIEATRLHLETMAHEYEIARGIPEKSAIIYRYEQALKRVRGYETMLRELEQEAKKT